MAKFVHGVPVFGLDDQKFSGGIQKDGFLLFSIVDEDFTGPIEADQGLDGLFVTMAAASLGNAVKVVDPLDCEGNLLVYNGEYSTWILKSRQIDEISQFVAPS